ncbi:hypothetical protein HZH68_005410 [Vespula germanica]|uniref:Uncharacterized protein n=1 Tax=Vespula germanica TaxID=30212 RepID=A0A834KFX7_VESGE|nr:hypothetical protein HZH68_005410 [Vespula germanica]
MGRRDHRPKNEEEGTKGEQRTETAIMRRCVPKQSVGSRFLVDEYVNVDVVDVVDVNEDEDVDVVDVDVNVNVHVTVDVDVDEKVEGRVKVVFIEEDNTWHGFGSVKKTSKHTMLQDIFNVETPRETALIPESLAAGQCCEAADVERLIIQDSGLCSSALCQERNPVVAIEGLYRSLPIP